jgi:hypothetical protein
METKFCTTCQQHKPIHGGIQKESRFRGWRCKQCAEHKSISIYQSQGKKRDQKHG